eukprot:SAG31_NODE_485_length_15021_cov_9.439791_11_plen_81_part_00
MAERAREGETHEILDHPLRLELWEFSKTAVKRLEIKTSFQVNISEYLRISQNISRYLKISQDTWKNVTNSCSWRPAWAPQ